MLLRSMETSSSMGLRDYAMFLLLMATYGLRASEIVTINLDDIRWRQGILRIHQLKTSSPLELPLTNEVLAALTKHLKRTPPPAPFRRVFLRMRAPIGVLKANAVGDAFQALVRKSGLSIPHHGPHCLRHTFSVYLLKSGTPLKTIGDILGHRTAESTCMYLRLATGICAKWLFSTWRAQLYIHAGQPDDALDALEDAYRKHEGALAWVNVEPSFRSLHSEPRFRVIAARVGQGFQDTRLFFWLNSSPGLSP